MQREKRLHVLFRRDALDLFEQIRSTLRRKIGVVEVPVDEGWTVWMRLRDALAQDEVVLIQGDRVMPGQKGQPVRFFDGHIQLPTGPVRLAMVTGSPIVPVFSVRMPRGKIRLFIEPPILVGDVPGGVSPDEAMNQLGAALEKYVRKYPEQWLENRPVWLEDAGRPQIKPPMKRRIEQWKAKWIERKSPS
jgi:KDO2-lipid IV(A) lauroyltransferase